MAVGVAGAHSRSGGLSPVSQSVWRRADAEERRTALGPWICTHAHVHTPHVRSRPTGRSAAQQHAAVTAEGQPGPAPQSIPTKIHQIHLC